MRKPRGVAATPRKRVFSFTLVELLVVMLIISILAALSIAAGFSVFNAGKRNRARAEIQAMSAALEGYKVDNGIYPQSDGVLLTNSAAAPYSDSTWDGTSTEYQTNSTLLYIALSGQTNYNSAPGAKAYMQFRANQVGNQAGPYSYIHDPWNYSYGYSTGTAPGAATTNYPFNGSGFYDLWSTAGVTASVVATNNALTNTWISTWTQ